MKYDEIAIGNRAYIARKSKNLKQIELSNALGMHQATYSKFENGRYDISLSELVKLCSFLDVPITWLLGVDIIAGFTDSECLELEKFKKYLISLRK